MAVIIVGKWKKDKNTMQIGSNVVHEIVGLLGIMTDSNLKFREHAQNHWCQAHFQYMLYEKFKKIYEQKKILDVMKYFH